MGVDPTKMVFTAQEQGWNHGEREARNQEAGLTPGNSQKQRWVQHRESSLETKRGCQ